MTGHGLQANISVGGNSMAETALCLDDETPENLERLLADPAPDLTSMRAKVINNPDLRCQICGADENGKRAQDRA